MVKLSNSRSWHLLLPSVMKQQKAHGNNGAVLECYVGHMAMQPSTKA
jgi:hypothetical protein